MSECDSNYTRRTYPVVDALGLPLVLLIPEELGLASDAYTIPNLLNTHIFEMCLVHFHEILAIDVVLCLL